MKQLTEGQRFLCTFIPWGLAVLCLLGIPFVSAEDIWILSVVFSVLMGLFVILACREMSRWESFSIDWW